MVASGTVRGFVKIAGPRILRSVAEAKRARIDPEAISGTVVVGARLPGASGRERRLRGSDGRPRPARIPAGTNGGWSANRAERNGEIEIIENVWARVSDPSRSSAARQFVSTGYASCSRCGQHQHGAGSLRESRR